MSFSFYLSRYTLQQLGLDSTYNPLSIRYSNPIRIPHLLYRPFLPTPLASPCGGPTQSNRKRLKEALEKKDMTVTINLFSEPWKSGARALVMTLIILSHSFRASQKAVTKVS